MKRLVRLHAQIARFMGPTWGPPGADPCWPHEPCDQGGSSLQTINGSDGYKVYIRPSHLSLISPNPLLSEPQHLSEPRRASVLTMLAKLYTANCWGPGPFVMIIHTHTWTLVPLLPIHKTWSKMCNPWFTESGHVTAQFVYINGSDGRVPPVNIAGDITAQFYPHHSFPI